MDQKRKELEKQMNDWAKSDICVAFSGGVDSSLLLYLAVQAAALYGSKVYAVTFQTSLHPQADLAIAKAVAGDAGAEHVVLEVDEFADEEILKNPVNRCYLCKRLLFTKLLEFAASKGISTVMEGSNADDLNVYRPGLAAVQELGILSPLVSFGIKKAEVRAMAEQLGISVSHRPSAPCLSTRLPYGAKIEKEMLQRLDAGESYLKELGFSNVRIRQHGEVSRIEVDKQEFSAILGKGEEICTQLKKMGFRYITLDLQGFRSGSMDEYLGKEQK